MVMPVMGKFSRARRVWHAVVGGGRDFLVAEKIVFEAGGGGVHSVSLGVAGAGLKPAGPFSLQNACHPGKRRPPPTRD
jgi:hypothetical protein